jgi:hypothetical protein
MKACLQLANPQRVERRLHAGGGDRAAHLARAGRGVGLQRRKSLGAGCRLEARAVGDMQHAELPEARDLRAGAQYLIILMRNDQQHMLIHEG